ncbi:hypothetical protein G6F31_018871 [Rhizopus arrhizus]|nr:hypothetical protein G6F31_018871 [Rhizopus arrhizus]
MATEIRIRKLGWAKGLRSRLLADNLPATLCAAALMGLFGALATVVFRELLGWTQMLLAGEDVPHGMVSLARGLDPWQRLLMPAVGGAIAGVVLQMAARWLPKRGAADYMEAISVGRGLGRLHWPGRPDGAVGGHVFLADRASPAVAAPPFAAIGGLRGHGGHYIRL